MLQRARLCITFIAGNYDYELDHGRTEYYPILNAHRNEQRRDDQGQHTNEDYAIARVSLMTPARPPPTLEAFDEARRAFAEFVKAVGSSTNGHRDGWSIKGQATKKLEARMAEHLAEISQTFKLFDAARHRLTTHRVW